VPVLEWRETAREDLLAILHAAQQWPLDSA
jgi:hypothetical protein